MIIFILIKLNSAKARQPVGPTTKKQTPDTRGAPNGRPHNRDENKRHQGVKSDNMGHRWADTKGSLTGRHQTHTDTRWRQTDRHQTPGGNGLADMRWTQTGRQQKDTD